MGIPSSSSSDAIVSYEKRGIAAGIPRARGGHQYSSRHVVPCGAAVMCGGGPEKGGRPQKVHRRYNNEQHIMNND